VQRLLAEEEAAEGGPPPAVIRAAAARAKEPGIRSSRFRAADGGAACGGAKGTAPYRGSSVWCLSWNDPLYPASCAEAVWTARSV